MNRLAVIHYPFFGGPHNQALRLSKPLQTRGIRTTVLLPDEPGNARTRLLEAGIDVVELPLTRLRARISPVVLGRFARAFAADVQRLRRLIRERNVDLVEIAGLVNAQGAVAAHLEGVPVVWQLLDTRAPALLRRALMPAVIRLSDAVMCTGRAVADMHPGARALNGRLFPFSLSTPLSSHRTMNAGQLCVSALTYLSMPSSPALSRTSLHRKVSNTLSRSRAS